VGEPLNGLVYLDGVRAQFFRNRRCRRLQLDDFSKGVQHYLHRLAVEVA
jgi:hypothetical protein